MGCNTPVTTDPCEPRLSTPPLTRIYGVHYYVRIKTGTNEFNGNAKVIDIGLNKFFLDPDDADSFAGTLTDPKLHPYFWETGEMDVDRTNLGIVALANQNAEPAAVHFQTDWLVGEVPPSQAP